MSSAKDRIKERVASLRDELTELALAIHAHPELGWQEFTAVRLIAELLERHGFSVTREYAGLATSFRADFGTGRPRVAFLAEYDALNGIGHGCGHNLIATCSTGAFLALASALPDGSVCLIGTPAEEGGAGKVALLRRGGFDDVDFALMMHPSSGGAASNLVGRGGRAASRVTVNFYGKGAHSSVPKNGVNALTALIQTFVAIDTMRPTFDPQDNINGIITDGGTAANVIPAFASGTFSLRADTMERIGVLASLVERAASSAAALTGARAEVSRGEVSAERYPNRPMNEAFKENMASLGVEMRWPDPKMQYGSSDIGNVSIRIPAIHDYLSICDEPVKAHTAEFAEAAKTPAAIEMSLKGAAGLAMTGYDILSDAVLRREIADSHEKQIPQSYKDSGCKGYLEF